MQSYNMQGQTVGHGPEPKNSASSADLLIWGLNDPELEMEVRRYRRSLDSRPRRFQLYLKRAMDILVASVCLVLTGIPLALLVAAIRLESDGPALFQQRRLGQYGKVFGMYKLRSMLANARPEFNADGSTRVLANDDRLTRIGRFIRRIGIDELPQLVNVIMGDMSLVGPRPDQDFHFQYYRNGDYRKLALRPGITSLAQAEGRNAIPWRERIALEITYVEQFSLWLDFQIILKTVRIVVSGIGSYNS